MVATFTTDQILMIALAIKDSQGREAKVDGVPVWATSDATVVSISTGVGGLSALLFSVTPGTARVTVTADADLGPGKETITGFLDVEITPGISTKASIIELVPGSILDK